MNFRLLFTLVWTHWFLVVLASTQGWSVQCDAEFQAPRWTRGGARVQGHIAAAWRNQRLTLWTGDNSEARPASAVYWKDRRSKYSNAASSKNSLVCPARFGSVSSWTRANTSVIIVLMLYFEFYFFSTIVSPVWKVKFCSQP